MVRVVSYGGGVNSTALLIELAVRKTPVDLVLFSDTGGEKPKTYEYIKMFNLWCVGNGLPPITYVKSPNTTLEAMCLRLKVLPSLAYGWKTCSQRFKAQPQNVFLNHWTPAKVEWKTGRKVLKLIGYDADEAHRAKAYGDGKYELEYPLIEWDMGRAECVSTIGKAGLPLPPKSACFFCPSSTKPQIRELAKEEPDLMLRALHMEANANLTTIKGLGRRFAWADIFKETLDIEDEGEIPTPCDCYDG